MRTPTKFVTALTAEQQIELQSLMKTSPEHIRCRAHAILLSARRYSIAQIADIYEVDRDTVSLWLRAWEEDGRAGLGDQPGRGRNPLLNDKEQAQALKIVARDPRSPKRHLAAMEKKTGKKISVDTLKKLLKKRTQPGSGCAKACAACAMKRTFAPRKPMSQPYARKPPQERSRFIIMMKRAVA